LRVLVACEFSGIVRDAFRELGHQAWSCDLLPTEGAYYQFHHQGDVNDILGDNWDLMIAHPPCTYLCVTGNKWFYHPEDKDLPLNQRRPHPKFPDRKQRRFEALEFIVQLLSAPIEKICLENPVGIISTNIRKPDQIIQPFQFGHKEPKKTCLWLKNLPKLQPTKIVEPEYFKTKSGKNMANWFYLSKLKGKERQKMRSKTS